MISVEQMNGATVARMLDTLLAKELTWTSVEEVSKCKRWLKTNQHRLDEDMVEYYRDRIELVDAKIRKFYANIKQK